MGTGIVLLLLISVIVLIIRSMIKNKKAGKSLQCGQGLQSLRWLLS